MLNLGFLPTQDFFVNRAQVQLNYGEDARVLSGKTYTNLKIV